MKQKKARVDEKMKKIAEMNINRIYLSQTYKKFTLKILSWCFYFGILSTNLIAAIWTVLPTSILHWGAKKSNFLGYISHCSFAPISTLMLFFCCGWVIRKFRNKEIKFDIIKVIITLSGTIGFILGLVEFGLAIDTYIYIYLGLLIGILMTQILFIALKFYKFEQK